MTTPLTPERLILDIRSAGSPVISPDGSRIAYTIGEVNRETLKPTSQIWITDPDGSEQRRLTWQGTSHSSLAWSPDGSQLAFVSKRSGEKPNAICVLPADGGESREIIRHRANPGSLAWSPDGTQLAYTLPVDPENVDEIPDPDDAAPKVRVVKRLDYKQDNRGFLNDVRLQVLVVEVESGELSRLTTEAFDHYDPQWSPDGKTLAVSIKNRNGMHGQLGLIDVAAATTTKVGPYEGTVGTWRWSRDGSFILFDGYGTASWQNEYFRYDLASGERVQLTDDLHFQPDGGFPTISGPTQPVWLDDRSALVTGAYAGTTGLWSIDAFSGAVTEVQRWNATHSGLSMDAASNAIVQTRAGTDGTGELVISDRTSGQTRQLTELNKTFFTESPPADVEYREFQRGGESIDYWLHRPAGFSTSQTYPVILDVHGGPHGNYGFQFNGGAQLLASNGYLVISGNPRGSGSYGRRFAGLVHGDWGGEDWLDLLGILDDVLELPYADATRTGIYGYSYGGYMTSWAIGQTGRFKAAVCGAPVFDMHSFYGTADIGHDWSEIQWKGTPQERQEWMLERSPSSHVHKATTPTIVLHGEADDRVPIGQGEQMYVGLVKAGVETEFIRYPGGSHLFLRSGPTEHKIDYYTRVLGWLDRFLK